VRRQDLGRGRLGMPVVLGMEPTRPNEWSGEIYNSRDGHTYDAHISLSKPDVLHVEGCVLGILCGGEDWTRIAQTTTGAPANWPHSGASLNETPHNTCTRLLGAGSTHEGGLK
jgi:hypothetical protein